MCITFFQNCASCLHGGHDFAKRLRALPIEIFTFLTPKRPQKEHFLLFYLLLSLFWPLRTLIFRFLSPLKFCIWPMTCALLASRAPSAKMNMHHTGNFVNFVYDLLFSLCLPCSERLFLQNILPFFEKMLPALRGKHDFESGTKAKS